MALQRMPDKIASACWEQEDSPRAVLWATMPRMEIFAAWRLRL
jgi:hypothetical protein